LPEGHGRQENGPNAFSDRKEPETKSITVVGLSDLPKIGTRVLNNLRKVGFAGPLLRGQSTL